MKTLSERLRRPLKVGGFVKVVGLHPGFDGQTGKVLKLIQGQNPNALITDAGYWTVAFEDKNNPSAGPLHRDVARAYLRPVKSQKAK